MNDNWAIRLSLKHLHRASDLRSNPAVEAAVETAGETAGDGGVVWLKGAGLDAALQRTLAPIADDAVFHLADDGRLTEFGHAVPVGRLPKLRWQRLAEVLQPVLPVAQMAFVRLPRTGLTLQRSAVEQKAAILLTSWDVFCEWALAAPEIRLQACRFAVRRPTSTVPDPPPDLSPPDLSTPDLSTPDLSTPDVSRRDLSTLDVSKLVRVLVKGDPLPPLTGQRYWLAGCVAVPLGFRWFPAVDAATLEATVSRSGSAAAGSSRNIYIWNSDDHTTEQVDDSEIIPVTRANVRATGATFV